MIKRVVNFVLKDYTNAMRNNIVIYGALFPILLAVVLTFFLPGMQGMKLTLALDSSSEPEVIEGWRKYARVELFDSREEIENRVEKPDDVAGIVRQGNEYVILLEGNEAGDSREIASILQDAVLSGGLEARYTHESLEKTNSGLREISASLILLTSVLIAGFVIGFNIVDEKETKAIKALGVSPLKMYEFITSHTVVCIISSIILAVISSLIFAGTSVSYPDILLSIICSTGIGLLLGFLIGGFADNLISAIAVVKVLMLFFVTVPIASLFVPRGLQWVFYLFPHYWAFTAYRNIFGASGLTAGLALSNIMALVTSVVILAALIPTLKKRLNLR